jgi:hypothetical protein
MLSTRSLILDKIIQSLDVPPSAYEAAKRRYEDLGEWLQDADKAKSADFSPHVFPQGSFRLGTVTKPLKGEDYDLDLACKLREGMAKSSWTQKQLKLLFGEDLERYRKERAIKEELEEKRRCWRLNYQDELQFHLDIVPAIPETEAQRQVLVGRMVKAGSADDVLAHEVAEHAMSITDNQHRGYGIITSDWRISNQEGYAKWFERRMRQAQKLLESVEAREKAAALDNLPMYKRKTPLQRSIQVLKRHRDVMFEADSDHKPISAIITTLAARAYAGEVDVESALARIVDEMASFVNPAAPRVPNPVNPEEDFADKWSDDSRLEDSFRSWLNQARSDFGTFGESDDIILLTETAQKRFGAKIDESELRKASGLLPRATAIVSGAAHTASDGTISTSGVVKNQPHKFYGQSTKADS